MENRELEQLESEIKKQLSLLWKSKEGMDCIKRINLAYHDIENQEKTVEILANIFERSTNKLEKSIVSMATFLFTYESYYMLCIDAFCYLLTANGHDLFDNYKRKYVSSLEEIENVDVSMKLEFLEAHNFATLNREQDRKLRNRIAHHDFQLDDSGSFKIKNEEIDIKQRESDLLKFTAITTVILGKCIGEEYQKHNSS